MKKQLKLQSKPFIELRCLDVNLDLRIKIYTLPMTQRTNKYQSKKALKHSIKTCKYGIKNTNKKIRHILA